MDANQLWQAVLGEIELTLSKPNFNTWFKNTFIVSYDNDNIIVGVPNAFTKAWFENKYHNIITKALNNVLGPGNKNVFYRVELSKPTTFTAKIQENQQINSVGNVKTLNSFNPGLNIDKHGLNTNYIFDNFIVGKFNELAHAAAQAVCEKPGKSYNPLFVYGSPGLGKTHLLQAIGNKMLKNYPQANLLYTTCENFTNEFVQSIKQGKVKEFQEKYRKLDILIMDDIQFMSKKEQTQEQFFHTYNDLKQADKQIVVASDRAPRAIPSVEQRLLSRLEWGMVADISEPDIESRLAIVETKASKKGISLEREIINYLAENIHNNIRELEGVLNRILAEIELRQINPDLETIKSLVMAVNVKPKRGALTSRQIIDVVANFYDIRQEDLLGNSRKKELVTPRQIVMYIMREIANFSFPNIGRELGGRDHTTAMHAYDKVRRLLEKEEKIKDDIDLIKQKFYEL